MPTLQQLLAAVRLRAVARQRARLVRRCAANLPLALLRRRLERQRWKVLAEVGEPALRDVGRHEVDLVENQHDPLPLEPLDHRVLEWHAPAAHRVARVEHLEQHVRRAQHARELLLEAALVGGREGERALRRARRRRRRLLR
eukprot:405783-Prymnesium_polylepis.3